MRDGVRLSIDIYRPEALRRAAPGDLHARAYGKRKGQGLSRVACNKGYALAVEDMRGRFDSEGNDSVVFHNDAWGARRDGQDSLEWIAREPWCNGEIATYGGSALGITQVLEAPGAPAALKAQFVQVAFSDMYSQAAYQGGVWRKAAPSKCGLIGATSSTRKSLETFPQTSPIRRFLGRDQPAEPQAARVDAQRESTGAAGTTSSCRGRSTRSSRFTITAARDAPRNAD